MRYKSYRPCASAALFGAIGPLFFAVQRQTTFAVASLGLIGV
jgi:hypothetical protein